MEDEEIFREIEKEYGELKGGFVEDSNFYKRILNEIKVYVESILRNECMPICIREKNHVILELIRIYLGFDFGPINSTNVYYGAAVHKVIKEHLLNNIEKLYNALDDVFIFYFDKFPSSYGFVYPNFQCIFINESIYMKRGFFNGYKKLFKNNGYEKIATVFHELSHIALNTMDLEYGVYNCTVKLTTPDQKCRNADNWGYLLTLIYLLIQMDTDKFLKLYDLDRKHFDFFDFLHSFRSGPDKY